MSEDPRCRETGDGRIRRVAADKQSGCGNADPGCFIFTVKRKSAKTESVFITVTRGVVYLSYSKPRGISRSFTDIYTHIREDF